MPRHFSSDYIRPTSHLFIFPVPTSWILYVHQLWMCYVMIFNVLYTPFSHIWTHIWTHIDHAYSCLFKFLDRAVFIFQNGNVDPVETCDWFHANITKEDAANYLARGSNLTYLYVRLFYRTKSVCAHSMFDTCKI